MPKLPKCQISEGKKKINFYTKIEEKRENKYSLTNSMNNLEKAKYFLLPFFL